MIKLTMTCVAWATRMRFDHAARLPRADTMNLVVEAGYLTEKASSARGWPRGSPAWGLTLLLLLAALPTSRPLLAQAGGGAHCDVEVTALSAEDTRTQLGTRRSDTLLQMVDGSGLSATLTATTTGGPYVSFRTPQPRWTGQGVPAGSDGLTTVTWTDPSQPASHTYTISAQGCVGTAKQVQIQIVDSRALPDQTVSITQILPDLFVNLGALNGEVRRVLGAQGQAGATHGGTFTLRKRPIELHGDPRVGHHVSLSDRESAFAQLASDLTLSIRLPRIPYRSSVSLSAGVRFELSVPLIEIDPSRPLDQRYRGFAEATGKIFVNSTRDHSGSIPELLSSSYSGYRLTLTPEAFASANVRANLTSATTSLTIQPPSTIVVSEAFLVRRGSTEETPIGSFEADLPFSAGIPFTLSLELGDALRNFLSSHVPLSSP